MLELTYTPSIELMEFLEDTYKDNTIKILNIFQDLDGLNKIYHNHNKIFLEKMEQRLLDIIYDSPTTENAVNGIEIYLKRSIDYYLTLYYIELDTKELSLYDLGNILHSLLVIQSLDIPATEELLNIIENNVIDNIERFVELISSYIDISSSYLFERVKQVDDMWFDSMSIYCRSKIHRGIDEVNNDDIIKIQPLLENDNVFNSTYIVRDMLYYGYKDLTFDSMLDKLYDFINRWGDNYKLVAMEIFATNFISKDKPIRDKESLVKNINFKAFDNIEYNQAMTYIVPLVTDYIKEIRI